ncbi:hypothetical protein NECAME_10174 [Necator americanus]|uniref:Uncharacterized protein n=1 Tax=Necator americanus TaxID=51031 RepID=W2T9M9_NECAM|nr:hypothetical protein NECAME_10174 [Necator americanus]ETN78735.1 hypothetical protein NECAME_10174 [Necator americanus]
MIDWQATEILAGCLFTARKRDPERLPDDYVDEIRRLLDRHKKIMSEYDFTEETKDESEMVKANGNVESSQPITESEIGSPVKIRSRTNSVKLQKLKEELEEYRIHADDLPQCSMEKCEAIRRSWGGLNDLKFDPVELPNSLDAGVQTTGTLDRMRMAQKIETTV